MNKNDRRRSQKELINALISRRWYVSTTQFLAADSSTTQFPKGVVCIAKSSVVKFGWFYCSDQGQDRRPSEVKRKI